MKTKADFKINTEGKIPTFYARGTSTNPERRISKVDYPSRLRFTQLLENVEDSGIDTTILKLKVDITVYDKVLELTAIEKMEVLYECYMLLETLVNTEKLSPLNAFIVAAEHYFNDNFEPESNIKFRKHIAQEDMLKALPNFSNMSLEKQNLILWELGYNTKEYPVELKWGLYYPLGIEGKQVRYGLVYEGQERNDTEWVTKRHNGFRIASSDMIIAHDILKWGYDLRKDLPQVNGKLKDLTDNQKGSIYDRKD